jgi:hypothetical protein
VTPFCPFDVDCARPVSAGSGASEAKRDSPSFVGPGGVDVADSGGWDDASSECPLPVEADGDEVVVYTPVVDASVTEGGVFPPDFVDEDGSRVDGSIVIVTKLLDGVSLSKSS